jgi:hypothetical protein
MASGTGAMMAVAGGTAPGGPATFTRVFEEVLNRKTCTSGYCHGMGLGNLMMTPDNRAGAYAALVGVAASGMGCGTSGKMRVVPGDPDASLMLEKISPPMPSCGDSMPLGTKFDPNCIIPDDPSVCTTQAEITLVRDWIAAGAMND